jgi:2-iminobutanoate/2-iminopropanoate deaminase
MMRRRVASPMCYKSAGGHSPAIEAGHYVFVSGQLPLDAQGAPVDGPVAAQVHRAVENLRLHLESAGLGLDSVVMLTVYLTDPATLAAVDEVCSQVFREPRPARTVVGVAFLPENAALAIEAIAVRY